MNARGATIGAFLLAAAFLVVVAQRPWSPSSELRPEESGHGRSSDETSQDLLSGRDGLARPAAPLDIESISTSIQRREANDTHVAGYECNFVFVDECGNCIDGVNIELRWENSPPFVGANLPGHGATVAVPATVGMGNSVEARIEAKGYAPQWCTVVVAPTIICTLGRGVIVQIIIVDEDTKTPLPEAELTWRNPRAPKGKWDLDVSRLGDGMFEAYAGLGEDAVLIAKCAGYVDNAVRLPQLTPMRAAEQVVLSLARGYEVAGHCYDERMAPLAGVTIVAGRGQFAPVTTGPDGRFAFTCPPGEHEVLIDGAGILPCTARLVVARKGEQQYFQLILETAWRLIGRIVDGGGRPIAEVGVRYPHNESIAGAEAALSARADGLDIKLRASGALGIAKTLPDGHFEMLLGMPPQQATNLTIVGESLAVDDAITDCLYDCDYRCVRGEWRVDCGAEVTVCVTEALRQSIRTMTWGLHREGKTPSRLRFVEFDANGEWTIAGRPGTDLVIIPHWNPANSAHGGIKLNNEARRVTLGKQSDLILDPLLKEHWTVFAVTGSSGEPMAGAEVMVAYGTETYLRGLTKPTGELAMPLLDVEGWSVTAYRGLWRSGRQDVERGSDRVAITVEEVRDVYLDTAGLPEGVQADGVLPVIWHAVGKPPEHQLAMRVGGKQICTLRISGSSGFIELAKPAPAWRWIVEAISGRAPEEAIVPQSW